MSAIQFSPTFGNPDALTLFERLANSTWTCLGDARRLNLGFSEDTISDLNMLEIARSGLSGVKVKRVTKEKERIVGFDWMWLVHRPGMLPRIYVVQAKQLRLERSGSYSYGKLKYPAGHHYQIDALEEFAQWVGAIPLYCFYNNVDESTANLYWNCSQWPPDLSQMGCTVAPLEWVRTVHDGPLPNNFHSIHCDTNAVPWRCLFHTNCTKMGWATESELSMNLPVGLGRALAFLPELMSGEEYFVDIDDLIRHLDLDELIDQYASDNFFPLPERIMSVGYAVGS